MDTAPTTLHRTSPSGPAPALPYSPAIGAAHWPAETKAIVAAAVAVSVVGLATSAKVLWMWLAPTLFRQSGVAPWPLFSVSTVIVVSRVLFDLMVIVGAAAAVARWRAARPLLLTGAAGLVVVITFATVWSAGMGPPGWGRYKGADLFGQIVYDAMFYVQAVVVRVLLVYAMTRPVVRGAARGGS